MKTLPDEKEKPQEQPSGTTRCGNCGSLLATLDGHECPCKNCGKMVSSVKKHECKKEN